MERDTLHTTIIGGTALFIACGLLLAAIRSQKPVSMKTQQKKISLRKGSFELENLDESSVSVGNYIDHTVLKPTTANSDITKLCDEAVKYGFAAVCVPPNFVKLAKQSIAANFDTSVGIATVIGFPFGYSCVAAKVAEVELAIKEDDELVPNADELDMVANISAIKSRDWAQLRSEVDAVLQPIRANGRILKVIIESGVLTDEEIIGCCKVYGDAGIDFLKTSTGYAESGASVHAVSLFRQHLPPRVEIKASGGIRDYTTAMKMIRAGATRIGCSAGVAIVSSSPISSTGSSGGTKAATPAVGGY
jgi:deoxyribose-phosphate aldolase